MANAHAGNRKNSDMFCVYEGVHEQQNVPKEVTRVRVDGSALEIGKEAFFRCHDLHEVDLSYAKRLERVGTWSFYDCSSLRKITLPRLKSIGDYAFYQCHNLTFLELPDGLQVISAGTFAGCHSLTHVALPTTITHIKSVAFSNCKGLVSAELPKGLEFIGNEAFAGCPNLKNILVPFHATVLPNAFRSCESLSIFGDREDMTELQQSEKIIRILKERADNKFVYKLCYYQCQGQQEEDSLQSMLNGATNKVREANCHDIFGMTHFHILALSARPNLASIRRFLSYNGGVARCRGIKDNWGNTAIDYLCQNRWVNSIFWREILLSLLKDRVESLGLEQWRVNMFHSVTALCSIATTGEGQGACRTELIQRVDAQLARYERRESLSLLELALWKGAMMSSRKEGVTDDDLATSRQVSRRLCRSDVVISNVLPFLEAGDNDL